MTDSVWGITVPELTKHATNVGKVAIAWAKLQDALGDFFALLCTPDHTNRGYAAWHEVRSDRNQREMLMAVAKIALKGHQQVWGELKWAMDRLRSLEDSRNDAIHTAYGIVLDDGRFRVIPMHFTGNPRANKLKDRDLDIELQSYAQHIDWVRLFIRALQLYYQETGPHKALPTRPALPKPAQTMTPKKSHPQKQNKSPPPQR